MKLTNEQLAKVKAAKSAEELLALAKENGMEMTDDEAKKYFADLHKEGELADDELDNVSGGNFVFKNIDDLNNTTECLLLSSYITVGDVQYHWAQAQTKNFVLFISDTGARLFVPILLFNPNHFPKQEDTGKA